jgi:hypothetical protein
VVAFNLIYRTKSVYRQPRKWAKLN